MNCSVYYDEDDTRNASFTGADPQVIQANLPWTISVQSHPVSFHTKVNE